MLQDKLLIWRLQRGSVDALRQIYDKYKVYLLKLAITLTGDACHSEDVVQDVFLKLAESYDRIGVHGNLKNFLITCLVNRIRGVRWHAIPKHERDALWQCYQARCREG